MEIKLDKNAKCAVIGYGSWGTALVKILQENEMQIGWYIKNEIVKESVIKDGINPKYLSSANIDTSKIDIFSDINEIKRYDIIIFATPSAFLKDTLSNLTESLEGKFIISAIKGLAQNSSGNYITIAEYFNQTYNIPFSNIGIITGPCHAEEVAMERLSYLNIVCTCKENAKIMCDKFENSFIKMNTQSDIYGIEYSVILKNIYALAVGICKGLGYGDNFIAVLITNAVRETKTFLDESYVYERDINTSAYLGDLLVTSYSQFSRNRTFGNMIGRGYSITSAKQELGMIAEGYYSAACIHEMNKVKNINLPIAETVYRILYRKKSARNEIKQLAEKLK